MIIQGRKESKERWEGIIGRKDGNWREKRGRSRRYCCCFVVVGKMRVKKTKK